MTNEEVLEVIKNETIEKHEKVPPGLKEHVFFVLNRSLEKEGKRKFVDDCGSWREISMKTIEYLANQGILETLYKKKGIYCRSVKRTQVPLDPQPETSEIYTMKRYYTKFVTSRNYQRRITWFEQMPEEENSMVVVVECLGEWQGSAPHGNAKRTTQPYKRTTRTTLNNNQ